MTTFQDSCIKTVQSLQTFDRKISNFNDIRYNFLISEDGSVFEGTGFNYRGHHTFDMLAKYYENSIGIFFIGNYSDGSLSQQQINATKSLIRGGIDGGKIAENYLLYNKFQLEAGKNRWGSFGQQISRFPHYESGWFFRDFFVVSFNT